MNGVAVAKKPTAKKTVEAKDEPEKVVEVKQEEAKTVEAPAEKKSSSLKYTDNREIVIRFK